MKNKYNKLVEDIDKQEDIVEQKNDLSEQLEHITANVETVNNVVKKLSTAISDLQEITASMNEASRKTENSAIDINNVIKCFGKVVFKHRINDEAIKQLEQLHNLHNEKELELLKKHHDAIKKILDLNVGECNDIMNQRDGIYLGRKTFIILYICFCVCFGIIFTEIVLGIISIIE